MFEVGRRVQIKEKYRVALAEYGIIVEINGIKYCRVAFESGSNPLWSLAHADWINIDWIEEESDRSVTVEELATSSNDLVRALARRKLTNSR